MLYSRLHFSVPTTRPQSQTLCDKIQLHEKSQTLFLMYQGSVYGYELGKGAIIRKFENLHNGNIVSMAYLPEQEALVTSTVDSGGTVRQARGAVMMDDLKDGSYSTDRRMDALEWTCMINTNMRPWATNTPSNHVHTVILSVDTEQFTL